LIAAIRLRFIVLESDMYVRELMTGSVEWVHPALSVREAARRMRARNIGCLPVGEGGRLLGMLTDRDIVCRSVADNHDPDHTKVRDIMTKGCAWCFEDQSLLDAAEVMRDRRIRRLPVLNHEQKVVGIISVDDLCEAIPDAIFAATMKATRESLTPAVLA
jgi:CBS domain-containing protein